MIINTKKEHDEWLESYGNFDEIDDDKQSWNKPVQYEQFQNKIMLALILNNLKTGSSYSRSHPEIRLRSFLIV